MTSFEDHERSLEEIKALFFYTMYLWTVALVSPAVISDRDFLVLFFFFYLGVFSCILSVYLGWCFLMYTFCIPRVLLLMISRLLVKKILYAYLLGRYG
jgi:hypothetical protein